MPSHEVPSPNVHATARARRPGAARAVAALLMLMLAAGSATAGAQEWEVPRSLSLEEALTLALAHSPAHLAVRNDAEVADWEVRAAYGNLLPSASVSSGLTWQGPGEQRIGSLTFGELGFGDQPSYYFSSYSLGLDLQLSGSALLAPREARVSRTATEARARASAVELTAAVTTAYLEALRQAESVALAEQRVERNRFNLRLARGQEEVGVVTPLDARQAEVQVGRAEVELLRSRAAAEAAEIRLLQRIGLPPEPVELTTVFPLTQPVWEEEELVALARRQNPELAARAAAAAAADTRVSMARSAYLPNLSLSAGVSAFTREASTVEPDIARARAQVAQQVEQCAATNELFRRLADPLPPQDCTRFEFSDEMRREIVRSNDQFPFDFTRQPWSASLTVSLPVFQGLSRQRDVEAAEAQRFDARQQLREQELAVLADVAVARAQVEAAYRAALLEERNRELADEQLRLARERYRIGAITFIDLVEAETVKAEADQAYLNAVFDYHVSLTELERVAGQPLR